MPQKNTLVNLHTLILNSKGTGKVSLTSDDMVDIRDNELIANNELRKDL
jgi:hypothetical protein